MTDAPYQLYAIVIVLVLVLVLMRERRRRAPEHLPGGLAGLWEDFRRSPGDRLAVLLLVVVWLASSVTTTGTASPGWDFLRKYGLQAVGFGVIAWFALRRKEFERLQTYRASFVTLGLVGIFIMGGAALADLPGRFAIHLPEFVQQVTFSPPSSRAVLLVAEITFLLSYLFLKRRAA